MIRALGKTDYRLISQSHTIELQTLCEGQRLIRVLLSHVFEITLYRSIENLKARKTRELSLGRRKTELQVT